jgi:hypothetical protein
MNCSMFFCLVALAWVGFQAAVFVGGLADGASEAPPLKLAPFDGESLPLNNAGQPYISQYQPSGQATVTLDRTGGVTGGCIKFELTEGCFYPQINAHNADGTRGFAREYVAGAWRWNTYNRLSFWIQVPTNNRPMDLTGRETMQVGTFVKRIREQDAHSDETGGGHWYHHINLPATGAWTKVVLNMHPHHLRGASGSTEHGNQPRPTSEPEYNCFDTVTRLYIEAIGRPSSYPAVFRLDEFQFYCEAREEADDPNLEEYAYIGVFSSGIFSLNSRGPQTEGPTWEEQNKKKLDDAELKEGLKLL